MIVLDSKPLTPLAELQVTEFVRPGAEHAEIVVEAVWRDVAKRAGLVPAAQVRLENAARPMLLRLFRDTRSVRRLHSTIEGLVALSTWRSTAASVDPDGRGSGEHRGRREKAPASRPSPEGMTS